MTTVASCLKCSPGTRVQIVNHPVAGLTGTVVSIDEYGQISLRIDGMDSSALVTVRAHHLEVLEHGS